MNAETQKVDVLAVMDRIRIYLSLAADELAQQRLDPQAQSMPARAFNLLYPAKEAREAVVELINVCQMIDDNMVLRSTREGLAVRHVLARIGGLS